MSLSAVISVAMFMGDPCSSLLFLYYPIFLLQHNLDRLPHLFALMAKFEVTFGVFWECSAEIFLMFSLID